MTMTRRIGLPTLLASLAVLALGAPCAASAATTVGQNGPDSGCAGSGNVVALQDPDWGPELGAYTIPFDGVITSFTASGQTKLLILEPLAGTTYKVVAKSESVTVGTDRQTVPTQIAVQAGQLIGFHGTFCAFYTTGTVGGMLEDLMRWEGPASEPATGAEQDFSRIFRGYRIDLSASLEPDADHDGFGDETQDCPTNAATVGPCPPAAAAATGQPAAVQKKCKKKKPKRARKRCQKKAKKLPV